jgi:predicted O-methyltransferase YrrM
MIGRLTMMNTTDLARLAWRRLSRVGVLSTPMARLREQLETLQFGLDRSTQRSLEHDVAQCANGADLFALSNRVFGPQQIEREILGFIELAKRGAPRTICEIGTANSGTTFLFSRAFESVDLVIGIDLFVRRRRHLNHLKRTGQKLALVDGDTGSAATRAKVLSELGGRSIDVLFIDGDHSLAGVSRDFRLYAPLVCDGGLVAFHDIVEDSFTRTGVRTEHWTGDVPRFWRALKEHYRETYEFIASPGQDGLGIGVVRFDGSLPRMASLGHLPNTPDEPQA